jgi:hypothetical protein
MSMATQRILIVSVGGELANRMWRDVCRWSDARIGLLENEWSHDDWPAEARTSIDAFIDKIRRSAFTPPVLYRCEHMDCWSMDRQRRQALHRSKRRGIGKLLGFC